MSFCCCLPVVKKSLEKFLISETYLDSSVSIDVTTCSFSGYNLVQSDHPINVKRGGFCLYYKENLSLRTINVPVLSQCVFCEGTIQRQNGHMIVPYWSPSQTTIEFDKFLSNVEKLLNFVKHYTTWRHWHWLINNNASVAATNIRANPFVTKLIILHWSHFTDHLNLVVDSGVILPCILNVIIKLFIINSILWLNILHMNILMWDYKHLDKNAIAKVLDQVDWNFFIFQQKCSWTSRYS